MSENGRFGQVWRLHRAVPTLALLIIALGPVHAAPLQPLWRPAVTESVHNGLTGFGAPQDRYAMSRVPTDCLDPKKSDYPDIRRHLSAIRAARLCYRRETVKEGRFRWVFHVFHHPTERNGPFWLLPHDDENTAFEAAVYAVATYGGGFLAIDSGQGRRFQGQDPNRNFSRGWSESMLCREQSRPAPKFTAAVMGHFKAHRRHPYLSLHNNSDGWSGNGGRGTISVHRSQGGEHDCVVVPVLKQFYIMLRRNLLYTAITRARKLVVLVGTRQAITIAVRNDEVKRRYSKLAERLAVGIA